MKCLHSESLKNTGFRHFSHETVSQRHSEVSAGEFCCLLLRQQYMSKSSFPRTDCVIIEKMSFRTNVRNLKVSILLVTKISRFTRNDNKTNGDTLSKSGMTFDMFEIYCTIRSFTAFRMTEIKRCKERTSGRPEASHIHMKESSNGLSPTLPSVTFIYEATG